MTGPTGGASAPLRAALQELAAAPGPRTRAALHVALADATVYVPVTATATATGEQAGLTVDKETEMALVTLVGTDGRTGLPVFSDLDAMAAWRADVRPVAVTLRDACASALAEGHAVVVLDVAGAHVVLGPAEVSAHAEGYLPVAGDDRVASRTLPGGLTLGPLEPVPDALAQALPALTTALATADLVVAAFLLAATVPGDDRAVPLLGIVLARDAHPAELAALGSSLAPALGTDAAAALDLMVLDATSLPVAEAAGLRLH